MNFVIVFYKDKYPVKYVFNDYADALEFAINAYQEEFVQSITIHYERTVES